MSCCYLICFARPYKHARHYLGYTKDDTPDRRIESHRRGTGANLMRVVIGAGIGWTHVRTWPGATRQDEIRLKKRGGSARHCPVCRALARGKKIGIPVDTDSAGGKLFLTGAPAPQPTGGHGDGTLDGDDHG